MSVSKLNSIRNAIETYYADEGTKGIYGIMNAFRNAIDNDEDIYVLTETVNQNGKKYNVFFILNDGAGHSVFPLFTDISEMMAVKNHINGGDKLNTGLMKLGYVMNFLIERKICDGIIINPSSQSFNAPISFVEDIFNR